MKRRILIAVLFNLAILVTLLWAGTTNYTQQFAASHGWTYTQTSCTGGGTCSNNTNITTDGNPANSISATVVGKSKAQVGYFSHAYTWENLGVPVGDVVSTVDGQWDDKAVQGPGACTTSATVGMQVFDSGNTVELTTPAVEANLDVHADTSAWTNHNPNGVRTVTSSTASSSTITLRFNVNPATDGTTSASCELRVDNYKLSIVSSTPGGRRSQTIVGWTREGALLPPETRETP